MRRTGVLHGVVSPEVSGSGFGVDSLKHPESRDGTVDAPSFIWKENQIETCLALMFTTRIL